MRVDAYIDLAIFEPLLQIVVDGFIGDLADQGKIRYSDFFLLGAFENCSFDAASASTGVSRPRAGGILLAACPLRDGLRESNVSVYSSTYLGAAGGLTISGLRDQSVNFQICRVLGGFLASVESSAVQSWSSLKSNTVAKGIK
jgi:hypothetical protein